MQLKTLYDLYKLPIQSLTTSYWTICDKFLDASLFKKVLRTVFLKLQEYYQEQK